MKSINKILAGIGLATSLPAMAVPGTDINTTFQARIVIVNACTALTATTLDFGSQGVLSADVNQNSSIKVTCTTDAPYIVKLNAGANAGTAGDVTTRRMTDGSHYVAYNLYSDAPNGAVWDNTTGTSHTGIGAEDTLTVYGVTPAQNTPPAGTYTDTVTVTLTY